MKKTIIISAGGTGGHIFPALAVTKQLQKYYNIIWVGGKKGLENTIVPANDIPLYTVSILGVRGNGFLRKLFLPIMLLNTLIECFKIIIKHKPVAVIGFGGYATFPICLSAKLLGKKVMVQEQNSVIGLTNKLISKFANRVFTAFPNVCDSNKALMLGNPIRQEIVSSYNANKYSEVNKLRVLIVGGSLGAKVLNETVPQALSLVKDKLATITHQVGRGSKEEIENTYHANDLVDKVSVVNFIDDMAKAFSEHDLIICRAGASTVAEVACAGIVPIFIPYPHAVDDHQTGNARYLVDNHAGFLLPQSKLTAESLSNIINDLTKDSLIEMSNNLYKLAKTDSTEQIVAEIRKIVD